MPCLRIKLPENKGEITHVLVGNRITIGRRPENTIQIIDRSVSGHHAELIGLNGHYRLHDLGSTNLTCVNGEPITDYHLHGTCKITFGTIECEFTLETPKDADKPSEVVPTRAELEFLRRENLDLQSKILTQQKQIDILSSARLMTKETTQMGVAPDAHRKITKERDDLRAENAKLKLDIENLKGDLGTIIRDRDAMRQAWDTVKAELSAAQAELAQVRDHAPVAVAEPAAVPAPAPKGDTTRLPAADNHRQMAMVLSKAPAFLDSIKSAIEKLDGNGTDTAARQDLLNQTDGLAKCASSVLGHPIQRLAEAMDLLLKDIGSKPDPLNIGALKTVSQAADLVTTLLDPRQLKRAKDVIEPRVLAIDDEQDVLTTLVSSLEMAGIKVSSCTDPKDASPLAKDGTFDLVFLDSSLPGSAAPDVSAKIRELPACKQSPIIYLTTPEDGSAKLDGANDCLAKPFNILELTLKAGTWIFRSQFGLS